MAQKSDTNAEKVPFRIIVDTGHPWRPPFGIDRVGAPLEAHVELATKPESDRTFFVAAYRNEREVESHPLRFTGEKNSYWATTKLESISDEIRLLTQDSSGRSPEELLRQPVKVPDVEADAVARPDHRINPVDLGAIMVPENWLLLADGQTTHLEVAALCRSRSVPGARLRVWFGDQEPVEVPLPLQIGRRETKNLDLPFPSGEVKDVLHMALVDGERTLWGKDIHVMIVLAPPQWPMFGVVETKLRYDAPISVIDTLTGDTLPSLDYDTAWDPKLNDVVVCLPNGSRFVFWRGTNYIPFWAGSHNTGVSYQWAENLTAPIYHPGGTIDFPEPLYDFELRYGHVQVVESTPSRIHVRWTYQSTDVHYRVWGDQTCEDFYFYPDGFGTRVVTIASKPNPGYQLSEFLILTPQSAFPLDVLPGHIADVLFLDGEKTSIAYPYEPAMNLAPGKYPPTWAKPSQVPAVYRIFAHKDDPAAAIYFSPNNLTPPFSGGPLLDRGQIVAPTYWGSHWPLGRGKITGSTIDERIYSSVAHNSVAGWIPTLDGEGNWHWATKPIETRESAMLDAQGHSRKSVLNRWAWLIAKTDASDQELIRRAKSFSDPPSVEVTGAEIDLPSYITERRAIRLAVQSPMVAIRIKPVSCTVDPVFEIEDAPGDLQKVMLDGRTLSKNEYAWDGVTLWVETLIQSDGARLELQFARTR